MPACSFRPPWPGTWACENSSTITLTSAAAPGRANTGDKMLTLVASALAGGDCIDAADALRAGGTVGVLGCVVKAPSTLGTFLRSFRWGHVRQLDRVSRQLLARGLGRWGRTPRRCGSLSGGVKPAPGSQLALFATYSYHGFITDRDGETLELEADHRRHAEVENAIRDLKYGVGLNHMPSARFAANGAWLAVQVMAHNLARWTARIGLGQQTVTTKTPQTTGLCLGRTDHPLGTPIDPASSPAPALGGAVQPRPGPTASHSTPSLTAPVRH